MSDCKECKSCGCPPREKTFDKEATFDEPLPVRYKDVGKSPEPDMSEITAPTDEYEDGDPVYVQDAEGSMVEGEVVGKTFKHLKVKLKNGIIRLFEPRVVERIVISFLAFTLLLACDPVDYGRLTSTSGEPLCPIVTPLVVIPEDGLFDEATDATEWWKDQVFPQVPFYTMLVTFDPFGVVEVCEGSLDPGQGGQASVEWRCVAGVCEITNTEIIIQQGLEPDMLQSVLRHELGHALGLADDDPGLGSIMQSPSTTAGGDVTAQDRLLVLENCE